MNKYYDITIKPDKNIKNKKVKIDIYDYASDLLDELEKIGIVQRIREIPQLGIIHVKKKILKTRYDYVMLQLYLNNIVKNQLQSELKFSYNNKIKLKEYGIIEPIVAQDEQITIGDIIQILIIVCNIGHFYNTFTASRAITMLASENDSFLSLIMSASESQRYKEVVTKILNDKNYHRVHLLNSILILEKCNPISKSVKLALEIIYLYINEADLDNDCKLKYVFKIFRKIRTISYLSYDLTISNTPLLIDVCNESAIKMFLKEYISEYNDKQSTNELISSIQKLLNDTVYNNSIKAICYCNISRKIRISLEKNTNNENIEYYNDLFLDKNSVLNKKYIRNVDYVKTHILKLTFDKDDIAISETLFKQLEKINNVRVGFYNRYTGQQTILVSIKNKQSNDTNIYTAFKIMKYAIASLRKIPNIDVADVRYLLVVKFFLFYLFGQRFLLIKPTITTDSCVYCTRGKLARIKEIEKILKESNGERDQEHEVEFLLKMLKKDDKNDTTITIPASIIVYKKDNKQQKECEFDGMIINLMRAKEQIVFLEAKNIKSKPSFGKKCLTKKINNLSMLNLCSEIKSNNFDAYCRISINKN